MIWKFFKNIDFQNTFNKDGYLLLDGIPENTMIDLRNLYYNIFKDRKESFFASNYYNKFELNKYIDAKVKESLTPYLDSILYDYRLIVGLYYIKPSGSKSGFHIHRDWSLVDEQLFSSMHIWLPLQDINQDNGNLFFINDFECDKVVLRGSPNFEYPKEGIFDRLNFKCKRKNMYMKSGEILFFDHRLKHGSNINISNVERIAVGISILPKNAPLIHYYKTNKHKIIMYEVSDDFYLRFNLFKPNFDSEFCKEIKNISV